MNQKLANSTKMWIENGKTTTLLFFLKILDNLERRGQLNMIVMEYFNGIPFHNSGSANTQYNYQSINQLINLPPPNTYSMMSSQDKMTQYINFYPHQWFELQDQQPRPSNKQKLKILKTNNYKHKRPVENVAIITKGLQDRNIHILDGATVENKGKLILTEIFPSVQKHDI